MFNMFNQSKLYSNDPRNSPRFNQANLQMREKLARHYGQNHEFQTYLDHSMGLVHSLATYNSKVCTSATLRMYKVTQSGTSGRSAGLNARSISKSKMKEIRSGHHGQKVASYAESGSEMVEITTNPLLDLLQSPNPIMPGSLFEHLKWYMCWVGGNGYEYKSRRNGVPFMLSPMLGQFVSIEASVEGGIERFNYSRSRESVQPFAPDEVIHYKLYPSPHSAVYGIGSVYGILPYADLIQDSLVHDISMAKNGMHPDGIWILPDSTTDADAKMFEKQLKSKFKGIKDYWKHLIFAGKVEFVSPQFTEKEMISLPKQEHSEKIIRQAFGHTESMADSTDTNVASAIQSHDKQFLGGTIWPALINDAAFKNAQLLPDFGLDPDRYILAYENPVIRDDAMEAEQWGRDIDRGIRTRNEVRIEMGLEPSDDEYADRLLVNGQPLGATAPDPFAGLLAGAPRPSMSDSESQPNPTGESSSEQPEQQTSEADKPTRSYAKAAINAVLKTWREPLQWRECPKCKAQDEEDMAPDKIMREAMGSLADALEASMLLVLTQAQDDLVRALMNGSSDDDIRALERALSDQMMETLGRELVPIVEFGGEEMLGQAGELSATFSITDERAAEFLRDYTIELADDLTGTTSEIAKRAVSAGIEMGLTEDEVVGIMNENGIAENRASMIARTETNRAVQNGKRQAMMQVGIEKVMWTNAPGARPSHAAIATRSPKLIDEPFVRAGEVIEGDTFDRDVFVPPAGPNCRCGIEAVFEED